LRQFYGFLIDEGLRADDPSIAMPRPRARRPLPRLLDHGRSAGCSPRRRRKLPPARTMACGCLPCFELLYGSGLRATELVSLPLVAVPRDAPFLAITGKGGQQRLVPVGARAIRALAEWLRLRPAGGRFVFPRRAAAPDARAPVPVAARSGRARRDRSRKGQPARAAPCLRHASAGRRGGPARAADLLGHADIATTQIYTHVDASRLVALVNERHPLAASTGRAAGRS
jgi:integrase/recombinase XerD